MTDVAVAGSVRGRVQGVSFRWSMQREATRLGVAGWVRNQPDGSVAFHAEGPRDAVDALLDWCRQGPALAAVDRVDLDAIEVSGATGFRITG